MQTNLQKETLSSETKKSEFSFGWKLLFVSELPETENITGQGCLMFVFIQYSTIFVSSQKAYQVSSKFEMNIWQNILKR